MMILFNIQHPPHPCDHVNFSHGPPNPCCTYYPNHPLCPPLLNIDYIFWEVVVLILILAYINNYK
jgi:hypothetical protein